MLQTIVYLQFFLEKKLFWDGMAFLMSNESNVNVKIKLSRGPLNTEGRSSTKTKLFSKYQSSGSSRA